MHGEGYTQDMTQNVIDEGVKTLELDFDMMYGNTYEWPLICTYLTVRTLAKNNILLFID